MTTPRHVALEANQSVECILCGKHIATESIREETFPYGSGDDHVMLSVLVPVSECIECNEAWTGEQAELIRGEAVRNHLMSLPTT
jgi:hypothetical protein|nr:hypothetical protein [Neorhizobium tomejilense]